MPLVVVEDQSQDRMEGQARFASIHNNVRSALRVIGSAPSSIYSRSPNTQQTPRHPAPYSNDDGPKSPSRPLFGLVSRTGETPYMHTMPTFQPPFRARTEQHVEYSPATQPSEWLRGPLQPAPVAQSTFRHPADTIPAFEPDVDIEAALDSRHKKPRRKYRRRGATAWTRKRKTQHGSRTCAALFTGRTRAKAIMTVTSGIFLMSMLAIYLGVALSVKSLMQEVHILFILTILAGLIFFVYSLIRLIVMSIRGRNAPRTTRPRIPSISGPDGFKPDVPIQVQLARDEELAYDEEDYPVPGEKLETLAHPPPAYGLWRGSVRLDPNLLHWQRVEDANRETMFQREASPPSTASATPQTIQRQSPEASPILQSVVEEPHGEVRRPPSYVSEDGVSYIVSALPPRPPSEIHPALRIRLT